MTDKEKVLSLTSKSVVYNEVWCRCKHIPDRRVMKEAALRVVMEIRPKDIEEIQDQEEKREKQNEWAEVNGPMVVHYLNEKRRYINGRLGSEYIKYFLGWDGTLQLKRGFEEAEVDAPCGAPVDLSKPRTLVYPSWLPNPEVMLKIVMRDPIAWGYDNNLNLVDRGKRDAMDKCFAFVWDKLFTLILGSKNWGVNIRCYRNVSTTVHASTEGILVWMLESNWERWETRAMYGISYPELKKHKKQNGDYLPGLEKLLPKYTTLACARNVFGGINNIGKDRLDELTQMVTRNRVDHADWIDELENRVRRKVFLANGQDVQPLGMVRPRRVPVKRMARPQLNEGEVVDVNDDRW